MDVSRPRSIGILAFALRRQVRRLLRVMQAVATDRRLPQRFDALAVKAVPDFGIDEVLLLVIRLLLFTADRSTMREILAKSRQ